MAEDPYDLIVIGSGPGGYVAAIRAAQLGLNTAVAERDFTGGRCLNYACMPAKTVLHAAEVYHQAKDSASQFGIQVDGVSVDWEGVQARREEVREGLSSGVAGLFKNNKIDLLEGEASVKDPGTVDVDGKGYRAKNLLLATGSTAMPIPGVEFGERVLDTWGAWSLEELPAKIAVVGAGASGAEIASAFGRFGTEVLLIEMLDQILPAEDKDMARVVARAFKNQNITISTGTKVENVEAGSDSVKFSYGDESAEVDYLVIAGGRAPDVGPLGLDALGVKTGDDGRIEVDGGQKTSVDGIYAIGDLTPGPALAHKASDEGVIAVEAIAGLNPHPIDRDRVPGATFCHPQVGSVGMTEAQAKEAGHKVKVGKFKLGGIGAAQVYEDRDGQVKIVADSEYGEILGAHIVGNTACNMIIELVASQALEGTYHEVARIIHPHPTISEAVMEAARAVDGWATHA